MDDLIRKSDAIEHAEVNGESREFIRKMMDYLEDAETVEPTTKVVAQVNVDTEDVVRRIKEEYDIVDGWIPCEERLPSEYGVYITSSGKSVGLLHFGRCGWSGYGCDPDAWMPLPEPWKGADDE